MESAYHSNLEQIRSACEPATRGQRHRYRNVTFMFRLADERGTSRAGRDIGRGRQVPESGNPRRSRPPGIAIAVLRPGRTPQVGCRAHPGRLQPRVWLARARRGAFRQRGALWQAHGWAAGLGLGCAAWPDRAADAGGCRVCGSALTAWNAVWCSKGSSRRHFMHYAGAAEGDPPGVKPGQ